MLPDLGLPPPSGVASSVHYYALQRNLGHVTRDTWVARHGQCMVWGTAGVGSAQGSHEEPEVSDGEQNTLTYKLVDV